jgi:hypothetical protein
MCVVPGIMGDWSTVRERRGLGHALRNCSTPWCTQEDGWRKWRRSPLEKQVESHGEAFSKEDVVRGLKGARNWKCWIQQ